MSITQTQCPSCDSYKTVSASNKSILRTVGLVSIVMGMALTLFIIGVPILLIGIVAFFLSFFFKETGKMRCRNCQFIFHK